MSETTRRTLDQKIADTEAKLARLRDRVRRLDSGRKVVLGGMLMAACRRDPTIARWTLDEIHTHVQRETDKARLATVIAELEEILANPTAGDAQEP